MNGKWCWWPCLGCMERAGKLIALKPTRPVVFLLPVIVLAAGLRAVVDSHPGPTRCGYLYPEGRPRPPKGTT